MAYGNNIISIQSLVGRYTIKPREKYLNELRRYLLLKQMIFLTGLRRVGKTTLMKLLIEEIINKGTPSKYILYVSLDDYLLDKNTIIEIINEYRKIVSALNSRELNNLSTRNAEIFD